MTGSARDLFPGGNTSRGFYSFYRYILSQDEARRIVCIKGGPGTGKSTLMRKVGEFFMNRGYNIEYHHCSSDNNSLDGVVIKELNIALLDGTAPHVVDPLNPGAVDEILNMGNCWREDGFKNFRKNIIDINKEVGKTFRRAYRFLGAAKSIHDDWSSFNSDALSSSKLNKLMEDLKNELFTTPLANAGTERHLFATAFTPEGVVTFIDSLIKDYKNIIVLNGGPGTGKTEVMNYISDEALKRGYFVEIFHDPLIPERIEHILIPELNTALVASNEINEKKFDGKQIYMKTLLNNYLINKNKDEIKQDSELFYSLLNKGLQLIASAKVLHDQMETYYVPNMNFDFINKVTEEVINKFLAYENEHLSNN